MRVLIVKICKDSESATKFINYLKTLDNEKLLTIVNNCFIKQHETKDNLLYEKLNMIETIIYDILYERENNI